MSGWIKLHRKITEWQWYNKSEYVHFFIHVLASANHKDGMWQGVEIKKGSLITSLDKLRVATGISAQSLRTIIKKLQNTGEIEVKSTSQWTMITVCKYDSYQLSDEDANKPTNKPSTKKQQAANKPSTTNNNDNNDKNEDNEKKFIPAREDFISYGIGLTSKDYEFAISAKYDAWVQAGWKDGNGKKVDNWKTKLQNTIPFLKPFNPKTTTDPMHDDLTQMDYSKPF
jgi:hypothetical protein